MNQNNHTHIDILKMDIEGAEYEVIPDILATKIPIGQIIVEFHHNSLKMGKSLTEAAMKKLTQNGYKVFHVSPSGDQVALIRW